MTERIGQQLGNYHLVRLLGKGGFADTYLGEHIYLKTFAAIKVLQTRLGKPEIEAFHNEARIIARLNHPHIVRVLEFDVANHTPYIIMEYAPNGTLRQHCPRGSTLSPTTVLTYVKQIAAALQYAHEQKLVHRDVKPENMLLGRDGEVLLSDFGVAIIAQTQAQNIDNIAGTVTYMAPEQIQGRPRPASDQYALGITAYEWLCGAAPFGGTYSEIALQHERVTPPSLREQVSTIPAKVEEVILTALAKDPRRRFASIERFAAALEEACKDLPLSERPTAIIGTDPQMHVPTEIAPPSLPQAQKSAVEEILSLDQPLPLPSLSPGAGAQGLQISPVTSEPLQVLNNQEAAAEVLSAPEQLLLPSYFLWPLPHLSNKQGTPIPSRVPQSGQEALATPWPSSSQNPYALVLLPRIHYQDAPGQQLLLPDSYNNPPTIAHKAALPYRSNTPTGVMLLLFLLALSTIIGSGFFYLSTTYQANLLHVQATAIAGVSVISTAQASITATGQVTATARSHTSAAIATQTALQDIYSQATSGFPTINDPLSSPDDFGWNNTERSDQQDRDTSGCKFTDDAYLSEASPGHLTSCMATETHFSNFAYQVDMTITDGASGGLIIRAAASGSGYYFRVSTNSAYFLEKITRTGYGSFSQTLLASGSSPVIKKGHNRTNQLAIVAQGKSLYLYVNKQYVDSISDASYSSGEIGVYADGNNYETEVIFRNAQVWKL